MDKQFEQQLNAAMELFKKRDYENALEEFKKLLELDNKTHTFCHFYAV